MDRLRIADSSDCEVSRRCCVIAVASSSATHRASITSSRPTGPTPSPVLALRPTCVRVELQDAGDALADGVLVVGQLGPLGVDDAVEVHDRDSRPRRPCRRRAPSISAESRPRLAASVLGNSRPMSGRAAAPSRASVTACSSTSASLWPTSCRSCGTSMPPSRSGPPGAVRCESSPIPIRKLLVAMSPGNAVLPSWSIRADYTGRREWRQRERWADARPQARELRSRQAADYAGVGGDRIRW